LTARYGWASAFDTFRATSPQVIQGSLASFLRDASEQQVHAWDESIAPLQHEVGEVIDRDSYASRYSAILEYELPMEQRRPDVLFLSSGSVFVLELKGKREPALADIDQAAAYARDLRAYHRECHDRPVHAILVMTRGRGHIGRSGQVRIVGLDAVDELVQELDSPGSGDPISPDAFLAPEAYAPLPTIVEAARELFESRQLRRIHRAAATTDPAILEISRIIHEAARTRTRRLILLTGVPGAGKTLVGLQVAHSRYLDDLVVPRPDGKPAAPAVYLSGNGPLVEVLQYEFRTSGGGGKAFVRGVKDYVRRYSSRDSLVPPEHVLIYDEAQRAWDAEQVAAKHPGEHVRKSEPEHFVGFAERVPEWCVILGLIGTGQEIHVGEEGGLIQWREAVDGSPRGGWIVHGPSQISAIFSDYPDFESSRSLHLDTEIRFHLADEVDRFVSALIGEGHDDALFAMSRRLEAQGYHLRITRSLEAGKDYLWQRYRDDPDARFGMVASSRDKQLPQFGVPNNTGGFTGFQYGPWYVEGDGDYLGRSCRSLRTCVTEFGAQGLELDATLLGWGADFIRENGRWTNRLAKRYQEPWRIRDAFQLRVNAYRVLLTRARDATVVFVPPIPLLDETYGFLRALGFTDLESVADLIEA
jgi:hypothetical protein